MGILFPNEKIKYFFFSKSLEKLSKTGFGNNIPKIKKTGAWEYHSQNDENTFLGILYPKGQKYGFGILFPKFQKNVCEYHSQNDSFKLKM